MTPRGRPVAFCLLTRRQIVEHLWSRADATDGNRWQTHPPRTPLDCLHSSAIACHYLPRMLHDKEASVHKCPSAQETRKVTAALDAVLGPYRSRELADRPDGSRRVRVTTMAVPHPTR